MYPLLEIKNLRIAVESEGVQTTVVENLNLTLQKGQTLGIAGESGSGKTVTALAVLRLLQRNAIVEGDILFSPDGVAQTNLSRLSEKQISDIRGKKIAMIFQEPMTALNPVYTCGDQVMEAVRLQDRQGKSAAKKRTLELFALVKLPDPDEIFRKYPHQLSGGQKQRVMIAMAMSGDPALLLCDEPTTALDVTVQQTVLELLKELQTRTGMGMLFISHDLGVIGQIAHGVAILYRGRVIEQSDVRSIFLQPQQPYTRALIACRPSAVSKGTRLPVVSDFLQQDNAEPGRSVEKNDPVVYTDDRNPGEPLVRVRSLSVSFPAGKNWLGKPAGWFRAVDDVSFEIIKGETLGIVGESGCGKTTLGRALLRLLSPSSGEIVYDGEPLGNLKGASLRAFRRNMQIVFQDPYSSLNPSLTIGSALTEPLRVHEPGLSRSRRYSRAVDLLNKTGLSAAAFNRYPHEFSGGQRQRIVIARALILNPSFVVCDESVSALDVSVQAQVLNLINDLKQEMGFTCVFISHDLSVIRYLSDRILVMNRGKIEALGPAEKIYSAPETAYTRRLIDAIPLLPV